MGDWDGGESGASGSTGKRVGCAARAGIGGEGGGGEELVATLMGGETIRVEAQDLGQGRGGIGGAVQFLEEEGAMPVEGPVVWEGMQGEVEMAKGEVVAPGPDADLRFTPVPGGDGGRRDLQDGAPAVGAVRACSCQGRGGRVGVALEGMGDLEEIGDGTVHGGEVPEVGLAVVALGEEAAAIGDEPGPPDDGGVTKDGGDGLAGVGFPDSDGAIGAGGGEEVTRFIEGDIEDLVAHPLFGSAERRVVGVPEPDEAIFTAGHDIAFGGMAGDGEDAVLVPEVGFEAVSGGDIPGDSGAGFEEAVGAGGQEAGSV